MKREQLRILHLISNLAEDYILDKYSKLATKISYNEYCRMFISDIKYKSKIYMDIRMRQDVVCEEYAKLSSALRDPTEKLFIILNLMNDRLLYCVVTDNDFDYYQNVYIESFASIDAELKNAKSPYSIRNIRSELNVMYENAFENE